MSAVDLLELPELDTASAGEITDCLCGVLSCKGHEEIDGAIHIPNHPTGYILIRTR
jgi:hypothetical protein